MADALEPRLGTHFDACVAQLVDHIARYWVVDARGHGGGGVVVTPDKCARTLRFEVGYVVLSEGRKHERKKG